MTADQLTVDRLLKLQQVGSILTNFDARNLDFLRKLVVGDASSLVTASDRELAEIFIKLEVYVHARDALQAAVREAAEKRGLNVPDYSI